MDRKQKYQAFRSMHRADRPLVMPNAWDAGTARILANLGFGAIATTSAGLALSMGVRDSAGMLSREQVIANAAAIVSATDLPVSADLEGGFGDGPEDCAETIRQAARAGLAGGSIEDASGVAERPIYDLGHAVERIAAAVEAARGQDFLLTARAENYLWGRPDLDDTIRRLDAFAAAGADVLYAPGLRSLDDIRTLCAALDKPVNVVMGLTGLTVSVEELSQAGVARISVGGSFARAALGALVRAAREVRDHGTFSYAIEAIADGEAQDMMR